MTDATIRGLHDTGRALLALTGADVREFLQGLVTNDVRRLEAGAVYAALLSAQGKYLHDFFLVAEASGSGVLVDVAAAAASGLTRRLGLYRLRADVAIAPDPRAVVVGLGPVPEGAFADPRHPGIGWRAHVADPAAFLAGIAPLDPADLLRRRIDLAIPEAGTELIPDDSYILEMGFERLHGVDFRKGCYVGQEVTARMKHKVELRKGLVRVRLEGDAPPPGTPILSGARPAGVLGATAGGEGLAWLRFDRAAGPLTAGGMALTAEAIPPAS